MKNSIFFKIKNFIFQERGGGEGPSERPSRTTLTPNVWEKVDPGQTLLAKGPTPETKSAKDPYLDIPGMTIDRLIAARTAVSSALKEISSGKILDGKDVTLKDTNYYLAIAIKESFLKPEVQTWCAKGCFQVTEDALTDVKRFFPQVKLTMKDIYTTPPTANSIKNNAIIGILCWHLCRDIYPKIFKIKTKDEKEKDKIAAFMYNIGSGNFSGLWKAIKPKNYDEFEKTLTYYLTKNIPEVKSLAKPAQVESKQYNITFDTYFIVRPKGSIKDQQIVIGGKKYKASVLIDAIHYVRMLDSIREKKYISVKSEPV